MIYKQTGGYINFLIELIKTLDRADEEVGAWLLGIPGLQSPPRPHCHPLLCFLAIGFLGRKSGGAMKVMGNSESLPERGRHAQSCVQTPALDPCYRRLPQKAKWGLTTPREGVSPEDKAGADAKKITFEMKELK